MASASTSPRTPARARCASTSPRTGPTARSPRPSPTARRPTFVNVLPQAVDLRSAVYTINVRRRLGKPDAARGLGRDGRQLQHHLPVRQRRDLRGGARRRRRRTSSTRRTTTTTAVATRPTARCARRSMPPTPLPRRAWPGSRSTCPAAGRSRSRSSDSPLPPITVPVAIDGTTEPGVPAGTMGVTLNGDGAGEADGLVLAAGSGGSTIRGPRDPRLQQHGEAGIRVQSDGNQIVGNYIGTADNGTAATRTAKASSSRATTTRSAARTRATGTSSRATATQACS